MMVEEFDTYILVKDSWGDSQTAIVLDQICGFQTSYDQLTIILVNGNQITVQVSNPQDCMAQIISKLDWT